MTMQLKKFHIQAKKVVYLYDHATTQGDEEGGKKSPFKPLQSCIDSVHKLRDVVISVMELPLHYAGIEDNDGVIEAPTLVVTGFNVSHTAAGTRSIEIVFRKSFRCGKVKSYTTPMVQIDDPADGEAEERALAAGEQATCNHAIEQAIAYIGGSRQESRLDGVECSVVADPNQTTMPLTEEPEGSEE